jgi:hypothetical protein
MDYIQRVLGSIVAAVTNIKIRVHVGVTATNRIKKEKQLSKPQTMRNIKHNCSVMYQPLLHTWTIRMFSLLHSGTRCKPNEGQ